MFADVVTQIDTHPRSSGSLPAALTHPLLQLDLAALRPVTSVEAAARCALDCLVLAASAGRSWPTALPLLPLAHRQPPVVRRHLLATSVRGRADIGVRAWSAVPGPPAQAVSTRRRKLRRCSRSSETNRLLGERALASLLAPVVTTWGRPVATARNPPGSTPLVGRCRRTSLTRHADRLASGTGSTRSRNRTRDNN